MVTENINNGWQEWQRRVWEEIARGEARPRRPWRAAIALSLVVAGLFAALCLLGCAADGAAGAPDAGAVDTAPPAAILRMPGSAFRPLRGALVAPVVWTDARLASVRVDALCGCATTILVCIHQIDPQDLGSTAVLEECAPTTACGPSAIVDVVFPTSFVIGDRSAVELVVQSPAIDSVDVRGAEIELSN